MMLRVKLELVMVNDLNSKLNMQFFLGMIEVSIKVLKAS